MKVEASPSLEKEPIKWKNFTVGVMAASSNLNTVSVENNRAVGKLLANNGFDAINGGYATGGMGTMAEGFTEVCKERGLSVDKIKDHLRSVVFSEMALGDLKIDRKINPTARVIAEEDDFGYRSAKLIEQADAIIVTEGGIGTSIEASVAAMNGYFRTNYSRTKKVVPVIFVDSKQSTLKWWRSSEADSPGTIRTLSEHIYFLSGHTISSGDRATVENDLKLQKQLELLLDYYRLLNEERLGSITESREQLAKLKSQLFDSTSPDRVFNLRERLAAESEFDEGGGI